MKKCISFSCIIIIIIIIIIITIIVFQTVEGISPNGMQRFLEQSTNSMSMTTDIS